MASWNGMAVTVPLSPRASGCEMAFLNTLQAYAEPIARWMDRAAGGINQRLHSGVATIAERSSMGRVIEIPWNRER